MIHGGLPSHLWTFELCPFSAFEANRNGVSLHRRGRFEATPDMILNGSAKKHKSTTISKLTECGRIMKDGFLLKYILLYIPRFDAESSMYPIKSYHFDGPWGDFCTHNMSSSGMNSKGFIQPRKGTSLVRTNLDGGTDHEPSNPKLSSLPKHLLHLSVGVERFH